MKNSIPTSNAIGSRLMTRSRSQDPPVVSLAVVTAKDTTGGSWLLDLVISLLPMALLVGMLFFMGRQSQRGAQSMFGFGGSKARLYNLEKPGVTFADVAGQVEAKADLLEVVDFLKRPE